MSSLSHSIWVQVQYSGQLPVHAYLCLVEVIQNCTLTLNFVKNKIVDILKTYYLQSQANHDDQ